MINKVEEEKLQMLPNQYDKYSVQKSNSRPKSSLQLNPKYINQQKDTVEQEKSIQTQQNQQRIGSAVVAKPLKNAILSSTMTTGFVKPSSYSQKLQSFQPNSQPFNQQKETEPNEKSISSSQNISEHKSTIMMKNSVSFSIMSTNKNKPSSSQAQKRATNTPTTTNKTTNTTITTTPAIQKPITSIFNEPDQQNKIVIDMKPQNIQWKINSRSKISLFSKELQVYTKHNSPLINLIIDTHFSNDQDFLNFCNILIQIAPKVKQLTWGILGNFKCEETLKQIGEVIGRCSSAFSINLNTGYVYFTYSAALSLTVGLNNLPNLRILQLKTEFCNAFHYNKHTDNSNNKIIQGIQLLKQLGKVHYNGLFWKCLRVWPNLANYVFQFRSQSDLKMFQQEIDPMREQLVELEIERNHAFYPYNHGFYHCHQSSQTADEEQIDYSEFFISSMCYIIKNLPYLTSYLGLKHYQDPDLTQIIKPYYQILRDLFLSRKQKISQIITFNNFIASYLPMNPQFILTDLIID